MRPIILHPKAREIIRRFPKEVRIRLGRGLFRLQVGEQIGMPNSRPMPEVAAGVSELRVRGEDGAYRAFYLHRLSARHPRLSRVREEDPADTSP